MLIKEIQNLMDEIHATLQEQSPSRKLPEETYYLNNGYILCCPRKYGQSRFPYDADGYTLWAHSNGYIYIKEGDFNVGRAVHEELEPPIEFFAGIRQEDGTFFPISVLGGTEQLFERYEVKRYLVYSLAAAYYIADTDFATFAVRANMSPRKEVQFSFVCLNKKEEPLQMCLTSYFEAFLKTATWDSMFGRTERTGRYLGDGKFLLERRSADYHAWAIQRKITGVEVKESYHTVSKLDFLGAINRRITSALSLKTGIFEQQVDCMGKEITPCAAEILHFDVEGVARIDYVLPIAHVRGMEKALFLKDIDLAAMDKEIAEFKESEKKRIGQLKIEFDGWNTDNLNVAVLNRFIENVQKQVDFCAMGKCSVDAKVGMRDVFQQLEQALIWDPEQAREKIVRALGYINPSGRSPRQFTIPEKPGDLSTMDLREFVDQGNWIISCIYTYLSWTNDFSILEEPCGYYEFISDTKGKKSEKSDSVREHLIKITDYLVRNIDTEDGTNCLRILYGDWNDALDGLGKTKEPGKQFGTGVSVMASLHFYQNLYEICEILNRNGNYEDKISHYTEVRRKLAEGLKKHAVETNEKGEKRLVHGWGDRNSYRIGSFCDSDGKSRISFAPNAFWVTTGLIQETKELKQTILDALHALDSRFGLLTLTPAFAPDAPGVGRLATILKGTAENECVYSHASMFSIAALFGLGDAKFAWEQIIKVLPITHEFLSRSPFVMANSYLDNPEQGLNGESAIDWYTGTGTVLIKNLVRCGLGIVPNLNGIKIQMASQLPFDSLNAEVTIKGLHVQFSYENKHSGKRSIYLDGKQLETEYDELMETEKAYIPNDALHENSKIVICD